MRATLYHSLLGVSLLGVLACSGGGNSNGPLDVPGPTLMPSAVSAVFDPANSNIPLPNVLATAAAVDPIATAWYNPVTKAMVAGARPYGVPMQPSESLAYVAYREVGGANYGSTNTTDSTHAVSGLNAPIYFSFTNAVNPATVTTGPASAPGTIKVFQVLTDTNNTALTENTVLGFQDVSALFDYSATPSATSPNPNPNAGDQGNHKDFLLFPKVPLTPGARYLYVVTNGVKDAAGLSVASSPFFEALKSTTAIPSIGPKPNLGDLEPIRADNMSNGSILLSGYAKIMNDLITNAAADTTAKTGANATGITSRANITLLGRFITTGAGAIRTVATDGTPGVSLKPLDAIIRAFAAGTFGTAKVWNNGITISAVLPAATYYSLLPAALAAAPHTHLGTVVLGSFHSADLQIDPALANATNLAGVDATTLKFGSGTLPGATNPYSFSTGITQAVRVSGQLAGFYNTDRVIPFVYFIPAGSAASYPTVILQHGITSQKEAAAAAADAIAMTGKATIAIDLPMHGALASPANTVAPSDSAAVAGQKQANWGSDFMSLTSLLTGRTNVQQAALNLHRLEILMRTGVPFATAFAGKGIGGYPTPGASGNITFVGQSLGSIVGAYYLAGNTTFTGGVYDQTSLSADMKGFLSVPGGTIAYILKDSPSFNGPNTDPTKAYIIDQTLGAAGVPKGSAQYIQFFLVAQTLVDPVDPASMTLPIATGLLSRLSGRLAIQEAVGDQVIPNYTTRYLGQALGGRTLFGGDFAPGFKQLAYADVTHGHSGLPFPFMAGSASAPLKAGPAATAATALVPAEGYFQFDQTGVDHGFLLDGVAVTPAAQKQLLYFLGAGGHSIVVDPYSF